MKKKLLTIILGVGVVLSSCQKNLLTPENQTQVADADGQPFSTAGRIQSQVLALYAQGLRGNSSGFLSGRYQIYNDVKAENWLNLSNNGFTAYNTWSQNVTPTTDEVINVWRQAYYAINSVNLFLEGMEATGKATLNNPVLAESYIGEAKFVRALSYYCLLQLYARPYTENNGTSPGLPLRLTGNSSYENFDMVRSTVAQVYNQILKDLNEAEMQVPLAYTTAADNTTRAHRNTIIALKTRVYLTMGRYADVITEANKMVGGTTFTAAAGSGPAGRVANALQSNIVNVFRAPYTTTESIFSMPFVAGTENPGTQNQLAYYFYQNASTQGAAEYYLNPTGVLADPNWKATDARKTGLLFTNASTGRVYITKYNQPSPYPDWAPVMRYAEVLLNLAEARARTQGIDAQAIALLNAVRGRSDASTVFTAANFADGTALINAILQERNIEFLGEGLRNIDLMRTQQTIPAKTSGNTVLVQAIAPSDPRYIWPISNNELLYNKLITNN
ncbi:RagB/SusD family nutrient uptake outer membrane protein [Mucilaginibacter lacusdianchii]|uniref:RagB/SusD family nutrient uptake outer membrane protein n=1 Tax=Mucilaginibacter lacusdianchii TaxID=2684211 RepID=UPI00131B2D49|nr:RagB/SusD family nutrient uptake outer membrane protein [Mucilaginibacter sp. JXJ CY 39]